jgi:hypothetical protein
MLFCNRLCVNVKLTRHALQSETPSSPAVERMAIQAACTCKNRGRLPDDRGARVGRARRPRPLLCKGRGGGCPAWLARQLLTALNERRLQRQPVEAQFLMATIPRMAKPAHGWNTGEFGPTDGKDGPRMEYRRVWSHGWQSRPADGIPGSLAPRMAKPAHGWNAGELGSTDGKVGPQMECRGVWPHGWQSRPTDGIPESLGPRMAKPARGWSTGEFGPTDGKAGPRMAKTAHGWNTGEFGPTDDSRGIGSEHLDLLRPFELKHRCRCGKWRWYTCSGSAWLSDQRPGPFAVPGVSLRTTARQRGPRALTSA